MPTICVDQWDSPTECAIYSINRSTITETSVRTNCFAWNIRNDEKSRRGGSQFPPSWNNRCWNKATWKVDRCCSMLTFVRQDAELVRDPVRIAEPSEVDSWLAQKRWFVQEIWKSDEQQPLKLTAIARISPWLSSRGLRYSNPGDCEWVLWPEHEQHPHPANDEPSGAVEYSRSITLVCTAKKSYNNKVHEWTTEKKSINCEKVRFQFCSEGVEWESGITQIHGELFPHGRRSILETSWT